jgi:hypothetical protein
MDKRNSLEKAGKELVAKEDAEKGIVHICIKPWYFRV